MADKPLRYYNMIGKKCAICEKNLHTVKNNVYFCTVCYRMWETEIKSKDEWTRFVVNQEKIRRTRRQPILIYLGDKLDIDDGGNLVRRSY